MKDSKLNFDRACHVIYSAACKKQIKAGIKRHYRPDERDEIWERVQRQYVDFLSDWRTDFGGKANFHNGKGGTYDCIALMSHFAVCKSVTSLKEIEQMESALFMGTFRMLKKLKFIDCNKPFFKKLMQRSFLSAKRQCDRWGDCKMHVAPFSGGNIYYEFTQCPVAQFAKEHDLLEVMPAMCNPITKPWSAFMRGLCA